MRKFQAMERQMETSGYKAIDMPGPSYIWVRELEMITSFTGTLGASRSYYEAIVQVVEDGDGKFQKGQRLRMRVGDGKPWFIRPIQYDEDYDSMFIQHCHVISTRGKKTD